MNRGTDVGANYAGEFIRRYSPVRSAPAMNRGTDVGANHAGEFIRRYLPLWYMPARIA